VESNTTEPEWNEQISFIEMFPPLAKKIKIQVLDDANVGDVAIATHYIDLQQISDPGRNGEAWHGCSPGVSCWAHLPRPRWSPGGGKQKCMGSACSHCVSWAVFLRKGLCSTLCLIRPCPCRL